MKLSHKYCLPIQAATLDKVRERIFHAGKLFESYEIWLSELTRFNLEQTAALAEQYGGKLIFVFRRPWLQPVLMDQGARIEAIKELARFGSLIDIDINVQPEDLASCDEALRRQVVLSYHNYESTPPFEELLKIKEMMCAEGTGIVKIAAQCSNEEDAVSLLRILVAFRGQDKVSPVVLGMGEHGAITRIFGPRWGNCLSFAPVAKEESSAPGQYTVEELRKLHSLLG